MRKFSTLDFAIEDKADLMAFLNVMGHKIMKQSTYLTLCRKLKFKMKLGYECLRLGCSLVKLWKQAIQKTLNESLDLAISNLQKYKHEGDGAPDYHSSGDARDGGGRATWAPRRLPIAG